MLMVILLVVIILIVAVMGIFLQSTKGKKRIEGALSLFNAGKYKEALDLFQGLYARDAGNKALNWYMGQCYENLQNYELALVEYNKASLSTIFNPPLDEVEIHKRIAMVNLELGNVKKSYQELQIVCSLDPRDGDSYYLLGVLAKNNGELQKGLEYLDKAIRYKKDYPEAYLEHGKINYLLNHADKAKRALAQAVALNPGLSEAHYYYALLLEKDRVYQKSIDEFQLAAEDERFRFDSLVHTALVYMAQNDKENTLATFERAFSEGSTSAENLLDAKYTYANFLIQEGDLAGAMKTWEDILAQDALYRDVSSKVQIYGEIFKSESLTRFVTSPKQEFVTTGQEICRLLRMKVENFRVHQNDLIEYVGSFRSGREEPACVVHVTRWTNQVGEIPVRELLERVVEEGAGKGVFITSSNFTEAAHNLAKIRPLELIEREKLEELLSKVYT
jgi:tetratricopeptide (TPR) repeat protein